MTRLSNRNAITADPGKELFSVTLDAKNATSDSLASPTEIIEKELQIIYTKEQSDSNTKKQEDLDLQFAMHKKVTTEYKNFNPHVNGFYYIQMVHGTWVDQMLDPSLLYGNADDVDKYHEFSKMSPATLSQMSKNFGKFATDIDIPQLNIEYESISGKARNLNFASKVHFASDFSINYIENYQNDVFRYHELWFKYVEALRKGFIKSDTIHQAHDADMFIDVPYFNAVWVVIFAPFSTNIRGLIKIMGVAPLNLPFKQIIGDRSKNAMTTINQNYKSNDMVHKFFETENELYDSPLYKEFKADMKKMQVTK